ncbi:DUF262 domain-containing protein [Erwinia rhapontici]|uniref:DUF262 domain-containing protein n=1 Tax=Erwinia rhapontici TaxID=55212 RepID=UPI003BA1AF86
MAITRKDILSVKELLNQSLTIPGYQRPYKWHAAQVNQLLDDVMHHRSKRSYRLGTVVLHQEKPRSLNIVDGQQRLLTLTLLCTLLDQQQQFRPKLLSHSFGHLTTQENLQHNAALIHSRINALTDADREELLDFLLHKCELIVVVLDSLSEAFQFFDSQNARGKPLEPHDLLKAFHLREMEHNSVEERTLCVARWENSVDPDPDSADSPPPLQVIMSDYLYRLRRWSEGQPGQLFTRHHLDVFKGVNATTRDYPFAAAMRAVDYQVDQYNRDPVRQWDRQHMDYPFQIGQVLINGKRFFEYIQYYTDMYQSLFIDDKPPLRELMKTINTYPGRSRRGDHYVRNLFFCAVMFYYDRFGDVQLEKAARLCFLWSYRIRLRQQRVVIESIDNIGSQQGELLQVIARALNPQHVLAFPLASLTEQEIKGTHIDGLIKQFRLLGELS